MRRARRRRASCRARSSPRRQQLQIVADVNAVPPTGIEGLEMTANGAELTPSGALGIGPLAIGNIKYKTEFGLFQKMIKAEKPVRFDFRDAFALARELNALSAGRPDRRRLRPGAGASARRGGYLPLVADFFADQDTAALAHARRPHRARPGARHGRGTAPRGVRNARADRGNRSASSAAPASRTGPNFLPASASAGDCWATIRRRVARVKDPRAFAALCRDCDIPHPDTLASRAARAGRLAGKAHGRRGRQPHRERERARRIPTTDVYFQRAAPGVPVSALFLADGRRAMALGFSTQWASPTAQRPFRYGGAVRPAALAPGIADALAAALHRIMQAIPLVGLNSADFLVDRDEFRLLEINPRPGATLDVFEPAEGSLFALHVAACEGQLTSTPPRFDGACAAAIVYAERDIAAAPAMQWPDWTADRPHPGTAIKAGEPLCTVKAAAATAAAAKARVDERLAMVLAMVHDRTHARMS